MADLKTLKKRCGAHRFDVKGKIQSSKGILASFSTHREADLELISSTLFKKYDIISDLDNQIQKLSLQFEEDVYNSEVVTSSDFLGEITKALWKIDKMLSSVNKSASGVNSLSQSISHESQGSLSGDGSGKVKLPKLELAKFNGDPRAYQSWKDSFDSAIHNNKDLSDIDKLLVISIIISISSISSSSNYY